MSSVNYSIRTQAIQTHLTHNKTSLLNISMDSFASLFGISSIFAEPQPSPQPSTPIDADGGGGTGGTPGCVVA
jgi:hypothetical protein